MAKYLFCLLVIIGCPGCAMVSRQYYYVPATAHQTINNKQGYFKMQRSQVAISDSAGKPIGALTTANGIGMPLFIGPPYLPVLPVGLVAVFFKGDTQFEMDLELNPADGYFMALAIDSSSYKTTRDSLSALHQATACPLKTTACYIIINGSKKIPLQVTEYFMGSTRQHGYRLSAATRFEKIRTLSIVTGNPLLDATLKNITFKRNVRITYTVMGVS